MEEEMSKSKYIILQLAHHLPFSVFGVVLSLLLLGFLSSMAIVAKSVDLIPAASDELFHVFHAVHILISSVASAAMFWKHDKSLIKAVLVGTAGSIIICGLSDIFFPYLGGLLLGTDMHLHICATEEPGIVYPFAIIGTFTGLMAPASFERATEYSHSMHIFVSSVASMLYLLAFGLQDWMHVVGAVFVITVISVMIPCCLSDIVFPLACSHSHCHHPDVIDQDHA
jgi:hypothetical protein